MPEQHNNQILENNSGITGISFPIIPVSGNEKDSYLTIRIKSPNRIDEREVLNSSRKYRDQRQISTNLINVKDLSRDKNDSSLFDKSPRYLREQSYEYSCIEKKTPISCIEKKTPMSDINDKTLIKTQVEAGLKDNMKNSKNNDFKYPTISNIYNPQ